MASPKEIQFKLHAGQPMLVDLVASDGKPYEIRLGLALLRIRDLGEMQPSPYGPVPKLEVQVQLAIDTRPKTDA
jgi:hypothetical protein